METVQIQINVVNTEQLMKVLLILFKNNVDCVVIDKKGQKVGEVSASTKNKNWFIDNDIKF